MIYYVEAILDSINGGGKVFLEHVYYLNKYGVKAKMVCDHKINWWFYDINDYIITNNDFQKFLNPEKDIIVFTGPWSYYKYKYLGKKCIYLIQGFRDDLYYPQDPYYEIDQECINDLTISKIAISNHISEYHERKNNIKIPVINNGLVFKKYFNENVFSKNNTNIFSHARKGVECLNTFLQIYEKKEISNKIRLTIKNEIISLDEIIEKFQNNKFFIDFSYLDGFGLMPLEAMASGCIVICLNSGGNQEFTKHMSNCFCFEKENINLYEDILSSIIMIENDNSLCEKMKKNAIETAKSFDWDIKIQDYISYYERLC